MLLVIYNSNPQNRKDLPTSKGWSLYTPEDWQTLCVAVDNYFFYLREDAELSFGLSFYYSYKQWSADYQVSKLPLVGLSYLSQADSAVLDSFLGTTFYVPDIATQPDDEPVYPEMDAYA